MDLELEGPSETQSVKRQILPIAGEWYYQGNAKAMIDPAGFFSSPATEIATYCLPFA
jgi:hypothetical protein